MTQHITYKKIRMAKAKRDEIYAQLAKDLAPINRPTWVDYETDPRLLELCPSGESINTIVARLRHRLDSKKISNIKDAFLTAEQGHDKQVRQSGEPYIAHIIRGLVYLIDYLHCYDEEVIITFILHDTNEDIPLLTSHYIRIMFGEKRMERVCLLTEDPYIDYYARLLQEGDYVVWACKDVDRFDNSATLQYMKPEKILPKIRETRAKFPALIAALKANPGTISVAQIIFMEKQLERVLSLQEEAFHKLWKAA